MLIRTTPVINWRLFTSAKILSKGIILLSNTVIVSASTQYRVELDIDAALAQKMAPSSRIIAWCITDSGEIITDSLDVTVDGAFANTVMKHVTLNINDFNRSSSLLREYIIMNTTFEIYVDLAFISKFNTLVW